MFYYRFLPEKIAFYNNKFLAEIDCNIYILYLLNYIFRFQECNILSVYLFYIIIGLSMYQLRAVLNITSTPIFTYILNIWLHVYKLWTLSSCVTSGWLNPSGLLNCEVSLQRLPNHDIAYNRIFAWILITYNKIKYYNIR